MPRRVTNLLIQMAEEDMLDWQTIGECCLSYMSEDEVADMARCNNLIEEEEEDE